MKCKVHVQATHLWREGPLASVTPGSRQVRDCHTVLVFLKTLLAAAGLPLFSSVVHDIVKARTA